MNNPPDITGTACPDQSRVAPAIAMGNRVIAVPSPRHPLSAARVDQFGKFWLFVRGNALPRSARPDSVIRGQHQPMKLSKIAYSELRGDPREWTLKKLILGDINLLVGRNAVGKTRSLNIIQALSNILSGRRTALTDGEWDTEFIRDDARFNYRLKIKSHEVVFEKLERIRAGEKMLLLVRRAGGRGKIWGEKSGSHLEFQSPPDQIVAVARRDTVQHNFLIPLAEWGKAALHFPFGREIGRTFAFLVQEGTLQPAPDRGDTPPIIEVFRRGKKEIGDDFVAGVIADMRAIGYVVSEVGVDAQASLTVQTTLPGKLLGLFLQEDDLNCRTEQINISAGMFAALSIIVLINFRVKAMKPSCMLIDDIGEGLDYERSTALIELLISKARSHSVQLIMASNDRFVMNKVPLEMWTVLNRRGCTVQGYNVHNSPRKFKQFRFTGLSNFDLLATNYLFDNETQ